MPVNEVEEVSEVMRMFRNRVPALVAFLLLASVLQGSIPLSNADGASPIPPVTFAILPDDAYLPSNLVAPLVPHLVYVHKNLAGDFDALLISGPMLTRLLAQKEGAAQIQALLSEGKTLLVLHRSTTDIRNLLHIRIPTMQTRTTRYLAAGVARVSPNTYIAGGVLLHKGLKYTPGEKAKDLVEFTARLHSLRVHFTQLQSNAPEWSPVNLLVHYLDECPFGKYNEIIYAERATNDASSVYDFWNAKIEQQTIGGYSACNSSYQTSRLWTRADVGLYGGQLLYRYGPTTTNAHTTANVDVGLTAGYNGAAVTLNKHWSFYLPDVYVIDHSDFSLQRAEWEFRYSHWSNAAKYTCLSEPGISVRVREGSGMHIYRPINTYWWTWWAGEYHLFDYWDISFWP